MSMKYILCYLIYYLTVCYQRVTKSTEIYYIDFPIHSFFYLVLQSEGGDKFNWGVKRHSVDLEDAEEMTIKDTGSTNTSCKDESSDDEVNIQKTYLQCSRLDLEYLLQI